MTIDKSTNRGFGFITLDTFQMISFIVKKETARQAFFVTLPASFDHHHHHQNN